MEVLLWVEQIAILILNKMGCESKSLQQTKKTLYDDKRVNSLKRYTCKHTFIRQTSHSKAYDANTDKIKERNRKLYIHTRRLQYDFSNG